MPLQKTGQLQIENMKTHQRKIRGKATEQLTNLKTDNVPVFRPYDPRMVQNELITLTCLVHSDSTVRNFERKSRSSTVSDI